MCRQKRREKREGEKIKWSIDRNKREDKRKKRRRKEKKLSLASLA